jgi:sugar/nucleoside kinase (ribokinase family)
MRCQVLVTLGEKGCLLLNSAGCTQVPGKKVMLNMFSSAELLPMKVKAVDTTGAGDSFLGSFAYFISRGMVLNQCWAQ